jgi:RNA polymerase sigma-70 factor (ECF subfamily)
LSHVQVVDPYAPEPVSDAELIDRVLAGDPSAERALYDAHVDRVFRLVYRMAGDLDRAQDWVQETFIRAFQKLGEFRGESALSTWLCSIAISVSLNGLRKVKRFREREVCRGPDWGRAEGVTLSEAKGAMPVWSPSLRSG